MQNNKQQRELQELFEDLNSNNFQTKKDGVRRVIAYMTVGKDVSPLFQSVIKCLEFPDIELKKLVYLYIINYSRHKPDDAIMVINLFRKDIFKGSALIKGLATRTMGCLRISKLNEYLSEPLIQALKDIDPYVRKTAVMCVPKVYEISADIIEREGIIQIMQNMLENEGNAFVLCNLVVSLQELSEKSKQNLIKINKKILMKLLIASNESIEWGQVFIMDMLANYQPVDNEEAMIIIDKILPRLQHINPSVVLAAIKLIICAMDYIGQDSYKNSVIAKITKPLITLVQWKQPEIQFTILKNATILLQKQPSILNNDVKAFFVKYNDPNYIKLEKLDILIKLCNKENHEIVLNELNEYSTEIDIQFLKKNIASIGKVATNFEKSTQKSISILLRILKRAVEQKADQIVSEVYTQMAKIYRKYPSETKNQQQLQTVAENVQNLEEPEAQASGIWILGEFYENLKQYRKTLQQYINQFIELARVVQLQLLQAVFKVFLKFPSENETLIAILLEHATKKCSDPDVRDKAYILWRAISSDQQLCVQLANQKLQKFDEVESRFSKEDNQNMLLNLGRISSTYHQVPSKMYKEFFQIRISGKEKKQQELVENIEVTKDIILQNPFQEQETHNDKQEQQFDLLDFDFQDQKTNQEQLINIENLLDIDNQQSSQSQGQNQNQVQNQSQTEQNKYDFFDALG